MFRLICEINSIIEAIFSKTGSFGPARLRPDAAFAADAARSQPVEVRDEKLSVFVGETAENVFAERMAAD